MNTVSDIAGLVKGQQGVLDDDPIDRLNRIWTPALFVAMATMIIVKEYVGEPIECWCPAFFKSQYIKYTNRVCWVSNTYYNPISEHIIQDDLTKLNQQLTYYQWTPFIILFQALLFFAPGQLWQVVHEKSGVTLTNLIEGIRSIQLASKEEDEKKQVMGYTTRLLNEFFQLRRKADRDNKLSAIGNGFCLSRRGGNFLVSWYMLIKAMYLFNCFLQFLLLNKFLSIEYHMYGIDTFRTLFSGEPWSNSPQFPHVTLCDFKVKQLNIVHRYTVQCVLQINFFNEKIFFVIWCHLLIMLLVNLYSFCSWVWHLARKKWQSRYVRKHIEIMLGRRLTLDERRTTLANFVCDYLRPDGFFILHIIRCNSSDLTVTGIIHSLWKLHTGEPLEDTDKEKEKEKEAESESSV